MLRPSPWRPHTASKRLENVYSLGYTHVRTVWDGTALVSALVPFQFESGVPYSSPHPQTRNEAEALKGTPAGGSHRAITRLENVATLAALVPFSYTIDTIPYGRYSIYGYTHGSQYLPLR